MVLRDPHGDAIDTRQGAREVCSVSCMPPERVRPSLPDALLRGSPSMPPGPRQLSRNFIPFAFKALLAGGADSEPQPRRPRRRVLTLRRRGSLASLRANIFAGRSGCARRRRASGGAAVVSGAKRVRWPGRFRHAARRARSVRLQMLDMPRPGVPECTRHPPYDQYWVCDMPM